MTDTLATAPITNAYWPASPHQTSLGLMVTLVEDFAYPGTPHFDDMVEIALAAKDAGFEALWFADHFTYAAVDGSNPDDLKGCWEVWTLMAGIAARVPDLQIGPLVACTAYRNPGVIAKMAEMIDDISGGRFILGLGAGWNAREYREFGYEFEPRVSKFEEALQIIHALLRTGESTFAGTHYTTDGGLNRPRGPRPSGPPILIGSTGPRMLRNLAQYGDAWNSWFHGSFDGMEELVAKVDAACVEVGRDPAEIVKTAAVSIAREGYTHTRPKVFAGSDEEIVGVFETLRGAGFRHVIVGPDPCTPEAVAGFAPVIDAFHAGEA